MLKGVFSSSIGSLPYTKAEPALEIAKRLDIPAWPQLPKKGFFENMYVQQSSGMPGARLDGEDLYFETEEIEEELTSFYERYLEADYGYFALGEDWAEGFYAFLNNPPKTEYVKGQITGPISFGLTVCDKTKKPIIYNDTLFEAIRKAIEMKAIWQAEKISAIGKPVIFLDEPYLSGFGSCTIPLTKSQVVGWLYDVVSPIKGRGVIVGVHCCGNTDWSILMEANIDILNFDAYNFAHTLRLYKDELCSFLEKGGNLAFGIVPSSEQINNESAESLHQRLEREIEALLNCGINPEFLQNFLITPSCGLGSLSCKIAEKVINTTKELSQMWYNSHFEEEIYHLRDGEHRDIKLQM
jgi:methionine synthase II (cobalamin-independent)